MNSQCIKAMSGKDGKKNPVFRRRPGFGLVGRLLLGLCLIAGMDAFAQSPALSQEEMRRLGLSDEQIKQAMKYQSSSPALDKARVMQKDTLGAKPSETQRNVPKRPDEEMDFNSPAQVKRDTLKKRNENRPSIYGQDIFRNNNIRFFQKATDIKAPDNYVLGPGDELNIAVWGFADYNESFRVNEGGFINSKLAGRIYVKGMKFSDARDLIRKRFSQVIDLNNSQSEITLIYSKVITVNIVGEVLNPGSYTIPSINTAFNALVAAKGPSPIGSVRNIYIKREGKIIDTLDVYGFLMDLRNDYDFYLQNNDYIIVPLARKVVTINGEVKRPDMYELTAKENLNALMNLSGGLNSTAVKGNVQVYRYENNKRVLIDVNTDSLQRFKRDFVLQDADSVNIVRISDFLENKVTVKGAVRAPGDYAFKDGERVTDLISKAQGIKYQTFLNRAYLFRMREDLSRIFIRIDLEKVLKDPTSPDNILLQNRDELTVLDKTTFADTLKIHVNGSVRRPGEYVYSAGMNLKSALLLAGGVKAGAANNRIEIARVIDYVDGNKLVPIKSIVKTVEISPDMSGTTGDLFELEPFDEIFVRNDPNFETPKNITITGEVIYPGKYTLLSKRETVSEVIARAGGLSQYAFIDGVQMYRKKDSIGYVYLDISRALKRPHSRYDEILVQEDSIIIPKITHLVHIKGIHGNTKFPFVSSPFFGKRAGYYVRNFAGGFTSRSLKRKVYVIRANGTARGTMSLGIINIYPKVTRGSTIYIPEKPEKIKLEQKPFDWNAFIEKTTIKLTGLLTLLILAKTFSQ